MPTRSRGRSRSPPNSAAWPCSWCATVRADCCGWNPWWKSPRPPAASPTGRCSPEDVAGLFEAGWLQGDAHPLRLGPTEDIPYLKHQERLTFARVGVTDPLSLDYAAHGGLEGLKRALSLAPEAIVQELIDSGLRGRGGAAFPTGIKWKTVAGTPADQKYIVCNADEGDSGTYADRLLMEGDPYADRGHDHRRPGRGRDPGLHLRALRIPARHRGAGSRHRAGARGRLAGRRRARQRSPLRPGSAQGRRRLHLRRRDLAAGKPGRQARRGARRRRCRPSPACSASPP